MTNAINETNAAPCGSAAAVVLAKLESVTENSDGTISVLGLTRGDNENYFQVEIRAKETAAEQVQTEVAKAKAKGKPGFRIWAHGPCEVDFATSKEGDQRVLKLCIGADIIRPAHPNPQVEPLQNSGVFFGSPSVHAGDRNDGTKYFQGSLEFPHLCTQREEKSVAPAAAKLTGASAEDLNEYNGKDVMVSGRFTRQTGDMNGKPYDHISLSVSTASEIRVPGGTTRMAPRATASNKVVTADYEAGFDDGGEASAAATAAAKAEFASMDF